MLIVYIVIGGLIVAGLGGVYALHLLLSGCNQLGITELPQDRPLRLVPPPAEPYDWEREGDFPRS